MPTTTLDHDAFVAIHERILADATGLGHLLNFGDLPGWYGYALGEIALLLDLDEIVHVDGNLESPASARDPHKAKILIFTPKFIVEVRGEFDGSEHSHSTIVRRRGPLRSLAIHSDRTVLTASVGREIWPGTVVVDFEYLDGRTYSLPMDTINADWEQRAKLLAFIPGLTSELAER